MILEKTTHPSWLANAWLVADRPGGTAVLIDTGGPADPILAAIREHRLSVAAILCTHHHGDHVENNEPYRERFGCPVLGHALEAPLFGGGLDRTLDHGEELGCGELRIRALHLPGHTVGQLGFLVDGERVFTGDTLFRGSVGGTCGAGHATFDDLRRSIMEVLMALPGETVVHPGHAGDTTIAREWAENPFLRVWRGLDPPGKRRCTAFDRPATRMVDARDYDGGRKCQVRFDEGQRLEVVPGSRVRVEG